MNNVNSHGQPTASGAANTASSASHQGHGNSIQQLQTPVLRLVSSQIPTLNTAVPVNTGLHVHDLGSNPSSSASMDYSEAAAASAITALGGYVPTQTPAVLTEVAPKRLVKLSLSVKEPASTASLSHALAPTLDAPVQAPVSLSLSANANRAQHHDLNAPTVGTPLSAGSKRRHNSPTHTAADLSAKTAIATEPSHAKIKKLKFTTTQSTPDALKVEPSFSTPLTSAATTPIAKKSELIPIPGTLKSYFTKIYTELLDLKDKKTNSRVLSEPFLMLPDKLEYPDYYQLIDRPIAFDRIKKKIDGSRYSSVEAYKKDVNLIFLNCQQYNLPESQIYQDSIELQKHFKYITESYVHTAPIPGSAKPPHRRKSDVPKVEMPAQVHTPTPTLIPLSAPSLTVVQPAAPVRSPQTDISTQRTALFEAIEKNDVKAFERHIASFDETTIHALQPCHMFEASFTWAPIHAVAYYGNAKMLEILMGHGADVEQQDTWYQGRPLAWAAFAGSVKICKILIEKHNADKAATNIHGQTAYDLLGDSQDDPVWDILKVNDTVNSSSHHGRSSFRTPKAKSATEEIKPTLSKSTTKVIGASHAANNWSHAPMEAATPTSRTTSRSGQTDITVAQHSSQRPAEPNQQTPVAATTLKQSLQQSQLTPQQQFQQQALYLQAQQQLLQAQTPNGLIQGSRSRQSSSKGARVSGTPQFMNSAGAAVVPRSFVSPNAAGLQMPGQALVPDNAFSAYTTQQRLSAPQSAIVTSIGIVSNDDRFRMVIPFSPDDPPHGFVGSCITVNHGVKSMNIRIVLGSNPFAGMVAANGTPVATRFTCTGHSTSMAMVPTGVPGSAHPQMRLEPLQLRIPGGKADGGIQDMSAPIHLGLNSFELIVVATAYTSDSMQPLEETHQIVLLAIYRQ
ncbi:hypothetical protein O5D80_007662 [Batrachochytrium dendrobatidis]|nr:hypothetical protein O5D80_007662 [Batrachochytrium dendrobatidis]